MSLFDEPIANWGVADIVFSNLFSLLLSLVTYLLLMGVLYLASKAWHWTEDFEGKPPQHPLAGAVAKLMGWGWDPSRDRYLSASNSHSTSDVLCFGLFMSLLVGPTLMWCFINIAVPLSVAALVLLLFLCRYVKRVHKKLNTHVADKTVHR